MALHVTYDGREYDLDLEDMDTDDARAMERFGVPNLKTLELGITEGSIDALTVAYWMMLKQNGEPGARLERVKFKPIKYIKALITATSDAAEKAKAEEDAEGKAQED
jgi:hypothetical protein